VRAPRLVGAGHGACGDRAGLVADQRLRDDPIAGLVLDVDGVDCRPASGALDRRAETFTPARSSGIPSDRPIITSRPSSAPSCTPRSGHQPHIPGFGQLHRGLEPVTQKNGATAQALVSTARYVLALGGVALARSAGPAGAGPALAASDSRPRSSSIVTRCWSSEARLERGASRRPAGFSPSDAISTARLVAGLEQTPRSRRCPPARDRASNSSASRS